MGYRQAENGFCERIVELAENGRIALAIPSFSVGESYETSYRRKRERESFVRELRRRRSQLSYSADRDLLAHRIQVLIEALSESIDRDNHRLGQVISRLAGAAEFISLDTSSLTLAWEYQRTIEMDPPDSLVLGSVVSHLSEVNPDECCFLNKNVKDFDSPSVRDELRPYSCRLIGSFEQGLNYISSTLAD